MDTTALINFNFQDRPVRIVEKDGEPWFVAKDVAEVLGYEWKGMSGTMPNVPSEWTGSERFRVRSENGIEQERELGILSEPGLYFFLGRSDKPLALPFQKWIAGDVIPSIRKKGFYAIPGRDREEQDEWKKNFPYPFLLLEDAASKMREMRHLLDKGIMTAQECRKVVLGDFGPHKPDTDVNQFVKENLTITGNESDYVTVADVYIRYEKQLGKSPYSRNTLVRKIKTAFPGLTYKQKKIDGYPVLVFCGCRLQNAKEVANA